MKPKQTLQDRRKSGSGGGPAFARRRSIHGHLRKRSQRGQYAKGRGPHEDELFAELDAVIH
jgi:hypothetical protein